MKHHHISLKHETITALKYIKTKENNEKMVDLRGIERCFFPENCQARYKGTYARKTIQNMLKNAMKHIPKNRGFYVSSAYRSLKEQKKSYTKVLNKLKRKNPQWPKNILIRETNKLAFPIDRGVAPYHSTGGAIDVYLCNLKGERIKNWDKDQLIESQHHHPGLSEEVKANRALIRNAMKKAGFTNFPMEFWHWSYGDSGWALRTSKKYALYGPVEEKHF